ncbi:MAG TPA: UDP-N-acetylmuramoyl-L-alanine--D-glutamate ligase [Usitatibacter sp.]|nr:UDP-N-acetylmuramoyl-L-alanine--D-glutamate ligase [Usitatibacter sp.]
MTQGEKSDEWSGKEVLVVGLGDTGLSSVRFLARRGARVRAADSRPAPPALDALRREHADVEAHLGPFDTAILAGVDAVVASPGVALREPLLRAAVARGVEVVGDVEVFARALRRRAAGTRVLGITGTNGKSTVTALAGAMGEAAGWRTVVAGNIGLPVLDAIDSPEGERAELFVIELSSYQLETTSSLGLDAAVMLNLTQDHLDRYDSMEDYARAKERIFLHAKRRVVNRDDPWSRAMGDAQAFSFGLGVPRSRGQWGLDEARAHLVRGEEVLLAIDAMPMQGLHNAANALASHALLSAIDAPAAALSKALRTFRGLPHRVELVAEAHGVRFYDDSKGTNVGATVAALEGMGSPVVLIAGGDGKGQDFTPLASAVASRARAVVLIGRDAPAIARALAQAGVPIERADSMGQAVEAAFELARGGDAVLLSPACASFDMFRNYKHRGEVFAEASRAIAERTVH